MGLELRRRTLQAFHDEILIQLEEVQFMVSLQTQNSAQLIKRFTFGRTWIKVLGWGQSILDHGTLSSQNLSRRDAVQEKFAAHYIMFTAHFTLFTLMLQMFWGSPELRAPVQLTLPFPPLHQTWKASWIETLQYFWRGQLPTSPQFFGS